MYIRSLWLSILLACSSHSPWQLDSLASGNKEFNTKKLEFKTTHRLDGINVEFLRVGEHLIGYLSTSGRQFQSNHALFEVGSEKIELELEVREGRMRAKLPQNLTLKMIEALQAGESVVMMVGGLEQHLSPEQFANFYNQLRKE